jgi:hypothetical protein
MITFFQYQSRAYIKSGLVFLLFTVVFSSLNLGLYYLLEPPVTVVTQLPYGLDNFSQWQVISGEWRWQNDHVVQTSGDLSLLVSPLLVEPDKLRVVAALETGAGISFAMQYPHKFTNSHWLLVDETWLRTGFIDTEGVWTTQAQVSLEPKTVVYLTLSLDDEGFNITVNGDEVMTHIPLVYKGQSLGLISKEPSRIHSLLVDRQGHAY